MFKLKIITQSLISKNDQGVNISCESLYDSDLNSFEIHGYECMIIGS